MLWVSPTLHSTCGLTPEPHHVMKLGQPDFRLLALLSITDHAGWEVSHLFVQVAKSADLVCDYGCRTPQGIRALARFYVVVFIPLFFGPYYADVRVGARSFAFSLFLAIFVSLLPLLACQAARCHPIRLLPFCSVRPLPAWTASPCLWLLARVVRPWTSSASLS